jgi:hypothetical protein
MISLSTIIRNSAYKATDVVEQLFSVDVMIKGTKKDMGFDHISGQNKGVAERKVLEYLKDEEDLVKDIQIKLDNIGKVLLSKAR